MNNEKRLISLFKLFMQRTCIALIKTDSKLLKEWLYFSTLISQEMIDYSKLQKYVDSLLAPISPMQQPLKPMALDQPLLPDYDGFLRKKQQIVDKYRQTQTQLSPSTFLNKTIGGQKTPREMLPVPTSQAYGRKASDTTSRSIVSDRNFSKRMNALYQQFIDTDKRLAVREELTRTTELDLQNDII